MANIFDKWNKNVDTKDLAKQVKEAAKKDQEFEDVPFGTYVVKIEKMELKETKQTHEPMFSAWFKVDEGEHKGRLIFMNQKVTQPFQIHIVNGFLRSLDCGDIEFEDYEQWNNAILDIHEEAASLLFEIKYYETKKGYSAFEVLDVFEG